MRYINKIFFVFICIFFWNCATNDIIHKKSEIPDWYLDVPKSKKFLYGIGEADGPDLGLTRISAEAAARDDIVRKIATKVSNMVRTSKQKVGLGKGQSSNVNESTSSQIASETIRNCNIIKKHIEISNGIYKIYALAEISIESVKSDLQYKISQEDAKRQLDINEDLQNILIKEIDKLNEF